MPVLSDGSPFAGTARYYARFRVPYAQAVFGFIVEARGLSDSAHVLDLGCGPGTIAIPLSHAVAEVIAVDPGADSLALVNPGKRRLQESFTLPCRGG